MTRRFPAVVMCLVLAGLGLSCNSALRSDRPVGTLAVLGAFDKEVELLEQGLSDARSHRIEGITFVSGRIGDRCVVVAWVGIGKVNAAMTATLLIEHFKPARVIVTGIAGAVDPNLGPGDIVVAERIAHHDMGIFWPQGIEPGGVKNRMTGDDNPVFFPADAVLLAAAHRAADVTSFDPVKLSTGERAVRVRFGTIVTGDTFVASTEKCAELREKFEADAVEMEGAAVAQICWQRDIGCLVIRSMSDNADESATTDQEVFYKMAAEKSAGLVMEIVKRLEK